MHQQLVTECTIGVPVYLGCTAMASRDASCSCGQLRLEAAGDPIRIFMCHCLGANAGREVASAIEARFRTDRVRVAGRV